MTRLCTLSPSRPASGESFTEMVIARVGGSIGCAGIGVIDRDVAERVGDGGVLETRDGDDVAGFGALHRHAGQAAEGQQLGDAGAFDDRGRRGDSALIWRLTVMTPDSMRPVRMRPR